MSLYLAVNPGDVATIRQTVTNDGQDRVTVRLSYVLPYPVEDTDGRDVDLAPGESASSFVTFRPDADGSVTVFAESFPDRVVLREDVAVDVQTGRSFTQVLSLG